MREDIFSFWARIGPSENIHPDDHYVLERVEHNFEIRCLPGAYIGPLRTAPIVLLYLSPGLVEEDITEALTEKGQKRYVEQRRGDAPLPGPDESLGAWNWWTERTNIYGDWEFVRDKIAFLNVGAYHSTNFANYELLVSLASSRKSIEWAQSELIPKAIHGERVVICMRANRYWGLRKPSADGFLYTPEVNAAGHMWHGEFREEIIAKVRERLTAP